MITSLVDILVQSSIVGLVSLGMTLIIITRSIDLSVGALVALLSVVYALVLSESGSTILGLICCMAAGIFAGALNGALVGCLRIPAFVGTLATFGIFRGLALAMTDGQSVRLPNSLTNYGRLFDVVDLGMLLFLTATAASWYWLHMTKVGLRAFALGGNPDAAALIGISNIRWQLGVFSFTGACCALAAVALTERLGAARPTAGVGYELDAITGVVLGGTSLFGGRGGIFRTFVAVLSLQTARYGMTLIGVSVYGQQIAIGLVLLIAILLTQADWVLSKIRLGARRIEP